MTDKKKHLLSSTDNSCFFFFQSETTPIDSCQLRIGTEAKLVFDY